MGDFGVSSVCHCSSVSRSPHARKERCILSPSACFLSHAENILVHGPTRLKTSMMISWRRPIRASVDSVAEAGIGGSIVEVEVGIVAKGMRMFEGKVEQLR